MNGTMSGATNQQVANLMDESGRDLLAFAFMLSGSRADAEDLVSEVMQSLMRRGIEDIDDPAIYARKALINLHRSMLRRTQAKVRALRRMAAGAPPRSDPIHEVDDREAIKRALGALSDRQRAAVVLRYFNDYDVDAIAEALGCATGTVRSLISRALPILRVHLMDDDRITGGPSQ